MVRLTSNDLNTLAPIPRRAWSNPWLLPAVGIASVGAYIISKYMLSHLSSWITSIITTQFQLKPQQLSTLTDIKPLSLMNTTQMSLNDALDISISLRQYAHHYLKMSIVKACQQVISVINTIKSSLDYEMVARYPTKFDLSPFLETLEKFY